MNSATELARKVVRDLIGSGVRNVVLSPGSRNAPLSIALFAAKQKGLLNLHVRIDERTAAFFALGIAKGSQQPVALVCTSGTAPANYHPALLEARHSMVPLIAVTADRPSRLRETGANQTTLQTSMFGNAVVKSVDLDSAQIDVAEILVSLSAGPVHINVQFDEPLLPDDDSEWLRDISAGIFVARTAEDTQSFEITSSRGVLVIGHDHGGFPIEDIQKFAEELDWPVVSEDPLSFPHAIAHSALFLASEKIRQVLKPETVVVVGRSTLSRSTSAFVKSASQEIVIDKKISTVDVRRQADRLFTALPALVRKVANEPNWKNLWNGYSRNTAGLFNSLPEWSEPNIARQVASSLPNDIALYVASSRPVRDLEAFAQPRAGIEVFANRGLAGIDGNISTALGIAATRTATLAILGDLSFLHDITGLIGAENIDLRILVINNDGGGIFSTLPQANVDGFEEIFGTPHGKDLTALAQALGIPSVRVNAMNDLLEKLSMPIRGLSIVVAEVPDRQSNAQSIKAIYSAIESLSSDSTH